MPQPPQRRRPLVAPQPGPAQVRPGRRGGAAGCGWVLLLLEEASGFAVGAACSYSRSECNAVFATRAEFPGAPAVRDGRAPRLALSGAGMPPAAMMDGAAVGPLREAKDSKRAQGMHAGLLTVLAGGLALQHSHQPFNHAAATQPCQPRMAACCSRGTDERLGSDRQ